MSQFSSYTRSTAFTLTMSQSAIQELLDLEVFDWRRDGYGVSFCNRSVCAYLQRRGLIEPATEVGCRDNFQLSNAGLLLCPLLREAGFKSEYKVVEDQQGRRTIEKNWV